MSASLSGDRRGTAGAGERRKEVSEFTWLGYPDIVGRALGGMHNTGRDSDADTGVVRWNRWRWRSRGAAK